MNNGNGGKAPDRNAVVDSVNNQKQSPALMKDELSKIFEDYKDKIARVLPKHLSFDKLVRLAFTSFQKNPKILECTRGSIVGSVLQAAHLGLEISLLGHGDIVPFFNNKTKQLEAQFIPGYQGLVDLARRSGDVLVIKGAVIYENDTYDYEYGINAFLKHKPTLSKRGSKVGVYAYATLSNGGFYFDIVGMEEAEKIRNYSKSPNSPAWQSEPDQMYAKGMIRRISKMIPKSVEFHKAVMLDEMAARGASQGLDLDQYEFDPESKSFVVDDNRLIEEAAVSENETKTDDELKQLEEKTRAELEEKSKQRKSKMKAPKQKKENPAPDSWEPGETNEPAKWMEYFAAMDNAYHLENAIRKYKKDLDQFGMQDFAAIKNVVDKKREEFKK